MDWHGDKETQEESDVGGVGFAHRNAWSILPEATDVRDIPAKLGGLFQFFSGSHVRASGTTHACLSRT